MENKIEKEYMELSKKYRLPKFSEIDSEFELSGIENERFLTKSILKKIVEKLEFYMDLLGNLVHPTESSLSGMYEMRFFSDEEKNDMYRIFKNMMKNHRSIISVILGNDEKKEAEFLNRFYDEWTKIKKELIVYVNKMKESWEKDSGVDENLGYFG